MKQLYAYVNAPYDHLIKHSSLFHYFGPRCRQLAWRPLKSSQTLAHFDAGPAANATALQQCGRSAGSDSSGDNQEYGDTKNE